MTSKVVLTILLLGISMRGYSCKCGDTTTIKESFRGSSVIVHGRVVTKTLVSLDKTMSANKAEYVKNKLNGDKDKLQLFLSDRIVEIRLVVIESFKGSSPGDTLTIYTSALTGSCRYWFDVNKEYIVYTLKSSWLYFHFLNESEERQRFEKENTYWAHPCTRTTEYKNSEIAALRKLKNDTR